MTKTKYFVIRSDAEDERIYSVANTLNEARDDAEQNALASPGVRFLIAAEVQSVVVETQVNWTDK